MEEGRDSLSEEESTVRCPPNSPIPPHLSDISLPPLRPSPHLRRVESLLNLAKADYHSSCRRSMPMEVELAHWHGASRLDVAAENSATTSKAASSRRFIPRSSLDTNIGHTFRTEASSSSALPTPSQPAQHEIVAAGSPHTKTQCDATFRQWRFEFGRFITEYDKYMRKSSNTLDLPEVRELEVLLPVLTEFGNIGLRYWFDHLRLEDEAHLENGGIMWEKSVAPSAEDDIPGTDNVESCTLNDGVDATYDPQGKGKEVVRPPEVNIVAHDGVDRKDWAVEAERKARRLASKFSSPDPSPSRGQEKSTPLTLEQLEALITAFSEARVFTRKLGITLSKVRHQQAQHPRAYLLREGVTFAQLLAASDSSSASQFSPGSPRPPSRQVYDPSPPRCSGSGSFSYPKYARYARLLPEDISALQNTLMSHCPLAGAALGLDLARDQYSLFYESIDAETQERYIDVLAPDPWHMSGALPVPPGSPDGCVPATGIQGVRGRGEAQQPSTRMKNHMDSDDDDNKKESAKQATAKEPLAAALSALWASARLSLINKAWRAGFVRDGDARRKFGKLRRRMEVLADTSHSTSYPRIVAEKAKTMEEAASRAEVKGAGGRDGMVLLSLVDTECREALGW
ncbi:uncharacterized protein E0L32_003380 [Thyridium curvatum]|uniref:Uncharacterized protein n=1 Tax=Thyridium curvatum TaxID=1093900 RepID=A0A507BJG3_9PEZI|nr:uncharacterized protein E0L32_003380 [Thyridium curvatum]TPX16818.1 hypothetical protein E0L32_003380 [Thyridium curvatum]